MKYKLVALRIFIMACCFMCSANLTAQEFSIKSFKVLPNDVSAFINTVRDLNDEACALVKVVAPADFAFSSPLGIVSRKDVVGEIWLYLPKGSKWLTLKHPQWGVLRNFSLGKPLESRMAYELVVNIPHHDVEKKHDTIVVTKTVIDTVAVKKKRTPVPLYVCALLTSSFHTDGPSWGAMFVMMRRHGFFVHGQTDFCSVGKTAGTCNKEGLIEGKSYMSYYTGKTRSENYAAIAGAIHRLSRFISVFEGVGYGKHTVAWQLANNDGEGEFVTNSALSLKGVAAEAGVMLSLQRVSVSTSALTVAGKHWQWTVGIGIKLGKKKK